MKPLREYLGADPWIVRAFLVKKRLRHLPVRPIFVLCVKRAWGIRRPAQGACEATLAAQAPVPGEFFAVVLSRKNRNFVTLRRALATNTIFERGTSGKG
jgi:hypothetical protein